MSDTAVNALIDRLVKVAKLEQAQFAEVLGAEIQQTDTNPFWTFYEFTLADGPFAQGELRLNASHDGALLILDSRDPPGLGEDDIDRQALGPRKGARPNPRIRPEGLATEVFEVNGVTVSVQWTVTSRKLTSVVLAWPAPTAQAPAGS